MIYKTLIFLVFIAEVVLCSNIIYWLLVADKYVIATDTALTKIKPDIKEVCELSKVISWQIKELSADFVEDVEKEQNELFYKYLSKLLMSILLWKMNIKFLKKIKRLKFLKLAYKGLSALANMV